MTTLELSVHIVTIIIPCVLKTMPQREITTDFRYDTKFSIING